MFRRHELNQTVARRLDSKWQMRRQLHLHEMRSKLARKNCKILILLAPRDGFAIDEKTSRILGFFDFGSLEIPPKTPFLKGGCCRILADVVGRH